MKLTVWPGDPTRVAGVDLQIAGAIDQDPQRQQRLRQARKAFGIQPGGVFRQAEWERAKQDTVHSLHHKLYAAARIVESRADVDPDTHSARLSVQIDSGPPFRFGTVTVTGLERYPPSIVTNLNPIRPGSPYDENELLKFQRRLLASGYFASAVVAAGSDPAQADATPIRVNVVEGAARRLGLGLGYSTDRGLRAVAQYTDKNTFDRALRFSGSVQVDQVGQNVVGGLYLPRNAEGHVYGVEAKYNYQDIEDLQTTAWSVTGARTFTVEERESQQSLQLLSEYNELADGTSERATALYLAQTWRWNNLDDLVAPRRGAVFSLQLGGAAEAVLSDASFGRLYTKGTYLLPVRKFGTVVLRAELGVVLAESSQGIPQAYVFRTGGDTTVRGYAYESLGVPQGGSIVGGRYLGVGSVEYIQWIKPDWGAAVFVDAGNAVDDLKAFDVALGLRRGRTLAQPRRHDQPGRRLWPEGRRMAPALQRGDRVAMKLARTLGWSVALLVALLLATALTLRWASRSESALRWGIAKLGEQLPCRLTVQGLSGSLSEPIRIQRLVCESDALRVDASQVELDWSPWALMRERLDVASLRAATLVVEARDKNQGPLAVPTDLALPLAVHLGRLELGTVTVESSADPIILREIDASYDGDARSHRLLLRRLTSPWGSGQGELQLGAQAPCRCRRSCRSRAPGSRAGRSRRR